MKKIYFIFVLLFSFTSSAQLVNYVNPFIGTGGHGHTFPGATAPFGFCQLSPDTRIDGSWDGCGGYHYSDSVIYGFSHTHLSGTGVSDYGDILLMPVTKEMRLNDYQYKSTFNHNNEKAEAGYYQVFLNEPKINVELTTSRHCGFHKYTFPNNTETYVVLDLKHRDEVLDSKMEQIDAHTIRGYRFSKAWATNQKIFFEIKFEQEIENILYETNDEKSQTMNVDVEKSHHALIKLKINNSTLKIAKLKIGISGVDEEGAHNNLEIEIPHWDFEKTKKEVQAEWEKELSKITVNGVEEGVDEKEKKIIFYTALYHCMIAPNIYSDVDNRYRGRDDKIHNTEGKFDYYTVFSLWDTYRALHPLLTIIDKKRTNDFINTFIKQYEQGGRLPIWELSSNETNCMIGYHAVSVIWDAYNKGIRDYDAEKAFEAMKSIATENIPSVQSYMKYGYVRAEDDAESVSKTLEYAYDDWCIAQMAKALGKEEDYKTFEKRSHNWVNVYDPTTGFMRARKNSTLIEPFSPYLVDNNYTEANSWQYSFYVPHEVTKQISLLGGNDNFEKKLDDLFSAKTETEGREQSDITGLMGQYAHGNEPSHHIAYLYHLLGKEEKGNKIIKKIMDEFYTNSPDGLIGNEDCGQMSAWYVLNGLGIYSFCPGGNFDFIMTNYDSDFKVKDLNKNLGSFRETYSQTGNSKNEIKCETIKFSNNESNHTEIGMGKMFSNETFIEAPLIEKTTMTFKENQKIKFNSNSTNNKLFVIRNQDTIEVKNEIIISESEKIKFYSENKKAIKSPIQTATFTKLPNDKEVFLNCTYGKTYHAGGPMGLVDGINGNENWRAGEWQGYQGQDFEAVIKYTGKENLKNLSANFLQDQRAWIFYPTEVSYYISKDSLNWDLMFKEDYLVNRDDEKVTTKKINYDLFEGINKYKKRPIYIKVKAKNYGNLPPWHPGAGNPAYIFIDEVELK